MKIGTRLIPLPQACLAVLVVVVAVAGVAAAATSASAFGAFNYDWDGSADARAVAAESGAETGLIQETSAYDTLPGNDTLVVVLGPTEEYTAEEQAQIRSYLRRGGTLLVAGDFGPGANDLLAGLNASVRISGDPIRDDRDNNYGRSPAFPIVTPAANSSLGENVGEIELNHPSALNETDAENTTVLASTSVYGYADRNRNDELDESEPLQSYPVVSREPIANGTLIAVSDPSVFINSMLERRDNHAFATAMFADYDRVRFDYSHTGGVPPLIRGLAAVRSSQLLQFGTGVALVGGFLAAARLGPAVRARLRRQRPEPVALSEAEIEAVLARRHPDWDEDRIQRIAARVAARRSAD